MMELQMQQQMALQEQEAQQQQAAAIEQQRQMVLKKILTPEAKSRLARIKLAHPEFATSVEDQLLTLAQSGRLQRVIDDKDLKEILNRIQPKKREINITRR